MSVCQPHAKFAGQRARHASSSFMLRSTRRHAPSIIALAAIAAILLVSGAARAQSINASGQPYPERYVNGADVGESTRPQNLNPLGINYSDCIQDMVLVYSVTLSGFGAANDDNMQVWATNTGDCTVDTTRGIGVSSEAPTCWLVNDGLTQPNLQTPTTKQFSIPVRALVGPQTDTIPKAGTLVTDQGPAACLTQPSFAATSVTVWFLPLNANGTFDMGGTPFSQTITADVVGPPAPTNVAIGDGDTLFSMTWMPNTDTDTIGYDIFIDPPPGSGAVVDAGFVPPTKTLYCPDAGSVTRDADATSVTSEEAEASDDASEEAAELEASALDGAVDATMAKASDAATTGADSGCIYVNMAPSPPTSTSSTCTSTALTSGTLVVDSGVATAEDTGVDTGTTIENVDEAGLLVETDSGTTESGNGGIASIPCQYLVAQSCSSVSAAAYTNTGNPTVTGETISTYVIKGLTDGQTYDVVIAAVDGSGNVGPPSTCVDDYPAPVNDFFKIYRQDGGQAGGSFCALEAVGAPAGAPIVGMAFGAMAFTMARRRRRNRR
jgi:hypothetical protein